MSAEQISELRADLLMRVLAYGEESGSYPYALDEVERALICSATPADWHLARTWLGSERFLIGCEFRSLEALLAVAERNPGRVPVGAGVVAPAAPAVADRKRSWWSRLLRRWRRRGAATPAVPDVVTVEAARWGLPVEDFRTAVLALDALGWLKETA